MPHFFNERAISSLALQHISAPMKPTDLSASAFHDYNRHEQPVIRWSSAGQPVDAGLGMFPRTGSLTSVVRVEAQFSALIEGDVMSLTNRRTTLKLLGGAGLAAAALPVLPLTAAAQQDLYIASAYQNFKRGTIHSLAPATRGFVIIWQDLGRVKLKAADLVTNYGSLKEGQIVDVQWYDYVDFLIAKKTPETSARGKAMMAQGARIEGIPGAQEKIRLWSMDGMCTRVDTAANTVYLINASGGEPDKPSPDSGEVIQMPQIVSPAGKAALATIKPGDQITTVFSVQTALKATIIR
jgi:hypothetical protein